MNVPPDLNAALLRLFQLRTDDTYRDPGTRHNPLHFRSRNDFLDWPDESVRVLKREMMARVAGVVAAVNQYSEQQFGELLIQARGWYSLVHPSANVAAASHPRAAWCAIYCVAAAEETAGRTFNGVLRLYESRLSSSYFDASNWRMRTPYGYGHHVWAPVAGSMAVFPASCLHEITMVHGERPLTLVTAVVRFVGSGSEGMLEW